jgi:Sulfatase
MREGRHEKGRETRSRFEVATASKPTYRRAVAVLCMIGATSVQAVAAELTPESTTTKPNIVIIWGDDIGQSNISAYSHGLMGYKTPNIDRVAKEGMMFTDYYGEQSCTAGRASFITGQSGLRTGLTKVGLPVPHWGCGRKIPRLRNCSMSERFPPPI